jgi:NADH:ubiquinone oxidoreductase subunit 6 (subunit J)
MMTTNAGSNRDASGAGHKLPRTLVALAVIVWAEVVMLAAWSVWYATGFFTDVPDSYAGAVLVLVLSVVATVWLGFAATHLLRRKTWTRAAILVWQLCQTAIAAFRLQAAPLIEQKKISEERLELIINEMVFETPK